MSTRTTIEQEYAQARPKSKATHERATQAMPWVAGGLACAAQ